MEIILIISLIANVVLFSAVWNLKYWKNRWYKMFKNVSNENRELYNLFLKDENKNKS